MKKVVLTPTALSNFKQKIENAVSMVATMPAEQKLEAVQYWNVMSEKLQEIVNHSAADISALTLEKENKPAPEYVEDGAGQTYHLLTSTSGSGSTMALIAKSKSAAAKSETAAVGSALNPSVLTKAPAASIEATPEQGKSDTIVSKPDAASSPEKADNAAIASSTKKEVEKPSPQRRTRNSKPKEDVKETVDEEGNSELHKWSHIKPYICNECNAKFATKGNLIVHTRSHTGERPYKCMQCTASFSTRGNLKRHHKAHSGEKPWPCTQCDAKFTENKSLKVHMRRHTGERPYKCTMCPKAFAQRGILQTHMALHLNQKAHLCDVCGKSFRQKSQLRLHKLRHNNVKRFTCPSCPAQFLTKGDMQRHKRTHTGERPFNCGLCKKTFTRQQTLTEHMNRHYGLKPYLCKYCRKAFAEMSACYKHIKTHEREGMQDIDVPVEGVIIDAEVANMNENGGTSVIMENDPAKYPEGLEVANNEMVISTQSEEQRHITIKNNGGVLCKAESVTARTISEAISVITSAEYE